MARVKGGNVSKNRRRKVLKAAKGYFGSKHRLYKTAQEQTFHSGAYAFRDRKQNKRNFRKLWITRINAACRENNISYSKFIGGLEKAGIVINRKMLSEVAIDNPKYFAELVKMAENANNGVAPKAEKVEKKVETVKEETTDLSVILRVSSDSFSEKGFFTAMLKEELSFLEPTQRTLPPRLIIAWLIPFSRRNSLILSAIYPFAIAPRSITVPGGLATV